LLPANAYTSGPMTHSRLLLLPCILAALALGSTPLAAQETVIPVENVRIDYAQVLRVDPVYQTLTATRMEQYCDGKLVPAREPSTKGISRLVGKVKSALGPKEDDPPAPASTASGDCRMVPIQREFRRPIAFDVDYMYKGMKYRSRLPEDPGNRLRVRISVTPYIAPSDR
jgi:uncharacterized protein YcfJ